MIPGGGPAQRRLVRAWPWLLALLFAAIQAGLLIDTARGKSDTWDEATYIGNGASQIARAEMCMTPVPPWGFGLALAIGGVLGDVAHKWEFTNEHYLLNTPDFEARLFDARLATILIMVLAGFFVWRTASRAGPVPAALAHALWCFSPSLLGNGCLATLDGWEAGLLGIFLWTAVRFYERPTLRWAAAAGAFIALAAGCKITALGAGPIFGALVIYRLRPRGWRILAALAVSAFAFFFTLWAACAFEVDRLDYGRPGFIIHIPYLPFPTWWRQLIAQTHHGFVAGHKDFLDGQTSRQGFRGYYLQVLALELPLATQLLGLLGVFAWLRDRRARLVGAALLAYPVMLVAVMSMGKAQLGLRYILPAAPFMAVWTAFAFQRFRKELPIALVLAGAISTISLHPNYLTYFNLFAGGPDGGGRYIVEGVDWCQDKKALAEWQQQNHVDSLHYTGCGPPYEAWGIHATNVHCFPSAGVFAIHESELRRPMHYRRGCLDWLLREPPDERINHTIWIYRIDKERAERMKAE